MPASGHVNPVLPVVAALVRRGIDIRFCATEEFRSRVEATGATFLPYPAGVLESADIAAATQSGSSVAVVERILEAASQFTPWLVEQLQDRRPTAVLHDSNTIWGRMAAASCSLPRISFMTTVFIGPASLRGLSLREQLVSMGPTLRQVAHVVGLRRRLIKEYGSAMPPSPMFPMKGDLTIFPVPEEFQGPDKRRDETCHYVGPTVRVDPGPEVATGGIDSALQDFLAAGTPPVVVSLGTLHAGSPDFFADCVAVLSELGVRGIVVTGPSVGADAVAGTDDILVRQRIPQVPVLTRARAFLTHGGMNSALEGIACGLPLVVVPQQPEQLLIGLTLADRDAAVVLRQNVSGRPVSRDALRGALQRVLTEPAMAAAARSLRDTFAGYGGAPAAADLVEEFLSERARP